MHGPQAVGDQGSYGTRMFSDYQKTDAYSGYGVEIPHGQSAAFNQPERTSVDASKANRGSES